MDASDPAEPPIDRRRVRLGLAMILAVIVVCLGLAIAVNNPLMRVFFVGLIVVAALQMWRLRRVVKGSQTS